MDTVVFARNLRRLIEGRGMTVKDFCIESEIPAATISRYLTGDREPKLSYVLRIAEFFNVSIDWLFGISESKLDIYPSEIREIASLYSTASVDDRKVIQAVLSKYRKD